MLLAKRLGSPAIGWTPIGDRARHPAGDLGPRAGQQFSQRHSRLRDIFPDVFVLGVGQLADVAVERHFSVAQNQKTHGRIAVLPTGQGAHLIGPSVELVRCHGKSILQAVGYQQGTGSIDVALLHDEFHDRVGSHRIESTRGGVI